MKRKSGNPDFFHKSIEYPPWNALKSSKTEGTEVATATEADDTDVDGGGGVGLIDAEELQK